MCYHTIVMICFLGVKEEEDDVSSGATSTVNKLTESKRTNCIVK